MKNTEAKYSYKSIPGQRTIGFLQVIGICSAKIFSEEIVDYKTKASDHLITVL